MKKFTLAALALVAISAQAADMKGDEGIYVGLNSGNYKLSCDDCSSESAFGVYAGYRMGDIAGEVSHAQKTKNGEKFSYTDIAAIPRINVAKDVDFLGKIGIRRSAISDSAEKFSGTSLVVGVGVEYTFMPELSARAMVDYSRKTFGESVKATTTTIGVAYKF